MITYCMVFAIPGWVLVDSTCSAILSLETLRVHIYALADLLLESELDERVL